ncbi:MAG: arsenate reductase (glutaredoxin) [Tenacibaculum sp.]
MIKIYHNNRCSKSRSGLKILENSGKDFEVIKYLENPVNFDELKSIIDKLGIKPEALLRKNEAVWKDNFKGKTLTDLQIIKVMVENPKLIERPIVVNGQKAVLGRPAEKIGEIL